MKGKGVVGEGASSGGALTGDSEVFGGGKKPIGVNHVNATLTHDILERRSGTGVSHERIDGGWFNRHQALCRLEVLEFDGDDAEKWVLRVEQYFEIGDFTEDDKLRAVRMCFIREALLWYRWERDRNPFRSWTQMKKRILSQYAKQHDTTAGEKLLSLSQTGTAKEYKRDFISLATNGPDIPEAVLEIAFMRGLKPKIRAGVRMFEPSSLESMMSSALKVAEWSDQEAASPESANAKGSSTRADPVRNGPTNTHMGQKNNGGPNNTKFKPTNQTTVAKNNGGGKTGVPHNRVKPPFRKLTPEEIAQRKAEGLCFKCDERFHRNHVCPRMELTVLIIMEDGSEVECLEEPSEVTDEEHVMALQVAELSINSVVGLSSPRTMKIRGSIQDTKVVVLIDSGATHNFISERLASQLGLETDESRQYGVSVARGVTILGKGVINNVSLQLQECVITTSFLPLELGVADVILGTQWLDTLGEMRVNWKLQKMKVEVEGKQVELRGDHSLHSAAVSLKALWKALEYDGEGVIVEFNGMVKDEIGLPVAVSDEFQELLGNYATVFSEPEGLPPSRGKEHAISIEPGAKPVSVRPFQYPQAQKAEIEK